MAGYGKASTFVELILTVLLVGIFALIAVPSLNIAALSRQKADYLAGRIITDLRRTRRMAISEAAGNTVGFSLNMVGTEPYSSYKIVNLNTLTTVDTHTIDSSVSCTGRENFGFGPLGNLLDAGAAELTVSTEDRIFTITVTPSTGMVKCTEN